MFCRCLMLTSLRLAMVACLLVVGYGGAADAAERWTRLLGDIPVGSATKGGTSSLGRIYRVTTLDDSGPGSLREALGHQGPRVVVFDVGGVIRLQSDLGIYNPWVTVAGQTAPAPVTIVGGTLKIRTGDVILQHIAVRPGPSEDPAVNRTRDAISIGPCAGCKTPPRGVLLDNVSLSWAIDENIGLFGGPIYDITVRNSIVAEGLRHGGHPKGQHSAGMLINPGSIGVEVVGNLFASNVFRNPAVAPGTVVVVANNLIYNPHSLAIHINAGPASPFSTHMAMINNVVTPGPDTVQRVTTVHVSSRLPGRVPDAKIFIHGSVSESNRAVLKAPPELKLIQRATVVPANWDIIAADEVAQTVLATAGSWPGKRDVIDARIIDGARSRSGRLTDRPVEMAALESHKPSVRAAIVPQHPFSMSGIEGMLRIEAWLCLQHFAVGGPPNKSCNATAAVLEDALLKTVQAPAGVDPAEAD
jgi:hypothetical protein